MKPNFPRAELKVFSEASKIILRAETLTLNLDAYHNKRNKGRL